MSQSTTQFTDAVIIIDHGSKRVESNDCLLAVVDEFRQASRYSIVEPAHMELAEPSLNTAFGRCVDQGAARIIVFPFFLFTGRHWHEDIPRLADAASRARGGVPYVVTAPLGNHALMMQIMQDRIEHCLAAAGGSVDECEACGGQGRCVWSDQR